MSLSPDDVIRTMRVAIAKVLAESSATEPAALLADLGLGLHAIASFRHASQPAPDSIAAERKQLMGAPTPIAVVPSSLPAAGGGPFQDYLRQKLASPDLRLDRVERLSGGFSRETIALKCRNGDHWKEIILRKEVAGGLLDGIGATVSEEFPILALALEGGVPTAPLLWLESDPSILGSAFIAMDRVAGYCVGTPLGANDPLSAQNLRQLAGILASLHAVDWRHAASKLPVSLGFKAEYDSPKAAAQALLGRWVHYWNSASLPASPLLNTAMSWMRDNIASVQLKPCITHGDMGFHNMMRDESGFTALLDWEAACLASPAKDIAHIRPSIASLVDWSLFLSWYRDAGGAEMSPEEIKWFEVFRAFSMTLVCKVALAKIADPSAARLEYLQLGVLAQPVFFDQLVALLA